MIRWDLQIAEYGKTEFWQTIKNMQVNFILILLAYGANILVLNGANGQQIVIDMDNSRIVVIGAVKAHDYDTYKLGYEPIKFGRIR